MTLAPASRRRPSGPGRARMLAVAALAGFALLAGCRSTSTPAQPEAAAPRSLRAPGLECQAITLRDDADRLVRTLLPFEGEPTGLDPEVARAWRGTGLRVVAVPVDRLPALLAELNAPTPADAGEPLSAITGVAAFRVEPSPRWSELLRQRTPPQPRTLRLAEGRLRLDPGSARLLARVWVQPVPDEGGPRASLRLEILPQWHEPTNEPVPLDASDAALQRRLTHPEEQGQTFERLAARFALDGRRALLILHEPGDADWSTLGGPRPIDAAEQDRDSGPRLPPLGPGQVSRQTRPAQPETRDPQRPEAGPPTPAGDAFRATTLGELLLARSADDAPDRVRVRQVLLLTPIVPERFSLLGY
jgi:hypothetical protein